MPFNGDVMNDRVNDTFKSYAAASSVLRRPPEQPRTPNTGPPADDPNGCDPESSDSTRKGDQLIALKFPRSRPRSPAYHAIPDTCRSSRLAALPAMDQSLEQEFPRYAAWPGAHLSDRDNV